MAEPVDADAFVPSDRESDLLARLARRRLELQMRGAGQLAMGVAEASRLVWDWMREPPELIDIILPEEANHDQQPQD